jgi:hypothetical protein
MIFKVYNFQMFLSNTLEELHHVYDSTVFTTLVQLISNLEFRTNSVNSPKSLRSFSVILTLLFTLSLDFVCQWSSYSLV